jgi:type I pantothenate kinase
VSGAVLSLVARAAERKLNAASPKLISVTGGVAVGKSTFARKLQRALMRRRGQRVEVVSTDGFLRSDSVLTEAGIMHRKGFPESFDHDALAAFFRAVRDPEAQLSVPVYCHSARGCIGQRELGRPDWLIIEGVYAQQPTRASGLESYAVFLDADQTLIRHWYTERFLRLHGQRFSDREQAVARAEQLYTDVNHSNYLSCIAPLRGHADHVLYKNSAHMLEAGSGGAMSPLAAFSALSSAESRSYTDVFGENGTHHADSIITHHRHHSDTRERGLQHRP